MSPHAYTEDQLVEQPAIGLFAELGWQTVSAMQEAFGPGGTLGRETSGEVVLVARLRAALTQLNPALPAEAITTALDELIRDRSAMSLEAANREVYELLKDGLKVSIPDRERGGQKTERLRVVDWETPANNDFLLVSQFSVTGALYTCRPDLVGFVNGLPWVVVELKKPGVPARNAFDENLTHYKAQIPALFWFNALLIASNGLDSRVGSLTADWDRWSEWKRIEREDEPRRVSMEVIFRGTCDKGRLLDLAENFTLFSEHKAGLVKILGQNHQVLGVNNAIASMLEARKLGHGRAGVFWQTQGSGKSFSMVFFSQKVLRKLAGNWTFVIVTDRVELDDQIAKTFKTVGAVGDAEGDQCHASSGAHLRDLLRGNHRYVFTLVHKFTTPELLCDRSDVVVLTDEAHRSQYDTLALNMRAALPKAQFLAFTGTPLIAGEERTKEVFGDYVSIYDFQQSIEDGATVPLFYENRTPELELSNPDLNDDLYKLIEEAELDPEQEAKLQRELGRQYHLITRDDRLESVAKDIVSHFLGRGFIGKAMVVSIDKATALKMHDKVKHHWAAETERVQQELLDLPYIAHDGPQTPEEAAQEARRAELEQRLGKRISQPDLSRLMGLLAQVGEKPLKRALAECAAEGRGGLHIDGDSTLIELHGAQEGSSYNGHYHCTGYHAGWMVDTEVGKVAALWLNPGKAYTSEGQAEVLMGIAAMGLQVRSYRGDAGMPSPELMTRLEQDGAAYTLRLKSNPKLDKLAEQLLPPGPWQEGRVFMGEFSYAAKSWDKPRRVVAKLQKPKARDGAESLFWEGYYFVTTREGEAEEIVSHYLLRGRAEGIFGEFMQTMQPNFRHEEMVKNEAWAQILALAFNTLVDLRRNLPKEGSIRKALKLTQELADPGFVAITIERVKAFASASLTMFRAHALKLFNVFISHARGEQLRIHPTMLRPGWPGILMGVSIAME